MFYGLLLYFMNIWYIVCLFGTFFPVLVSYPKKNLATLTWTIENAEILDAFVNPLDSRWLFGVSGLFLILVTHHGLRGVSDQRGLVGSSPPGELWGREIESR
jgi:hypothetical protein